MRQVLKGNHFQIIIRHAPGGAKSKSYRRTPKERKMALKHRTPPALNKHRYLYQFWPSRIKFWVPGRPLGFDFRTWGYNLGPPGIDFVPILGLYSSRLDLWESILCFRDSTLDPWESIFGVGDSILDPCKSIFGPFWLLGFNFRPLGFDFRTWGVNFIDFRTWGYNVGLQESTFSWFWGSTVHDGTFESQFWAFWTQVWISESRFWAFKTRFWSPGSQFLVQFGMSEIRDFLNTI